MQTQNSMNDLTENSNREVLSKESVQICDGLVGDLVSCYYPDYGFADHVESIRVENGDFRKSRSLIPPRFANDDWNSFKWQLYRTDITTPRSIALGYITHFDEEARKNGTGLYIFSETKGSGKTKLACVILNQIMNSRDICGKFLSVPTLLEMTQQSYREFAKREDIYSFYNAELLILDDLGIGAKNAWVDKQLYELVNYRTDYQKATIVTSNIPIEKLKEKVDERIVARVHDGCPVLPLPEQSIRAEQANQKNYEFLKRITE